MPGHSGNPSGGVTCSSSRFGSRSVVALWAAALFMAVALAHTYTKYYLSEKVRKYVLASGTKNFYSKPKIDLEVARPLLTTMHKMHRAGVDNYVTTDGRIRKLTPRECLRLMGFSDDFKITVSDTSMYQQAGNSIVVDVLIAIMDEVFKSFPNLGKENS